jgi:isopentenyl diphosphate isomerase/L-lactate dehydrogenase-like FMN-dependent dehydrogenase
MGQKYGRAIGFGGAGQGRTFSANFKALENIRLVTRLVKPHKEPVLNSDFLDNPISMPVMVTSVSGVKISMNGVIEEKEFQERMIEGARFSGTIGMSGHTVDAPEHPGLIIIKKNGGWGIPVFKPLEQKKLLSLFKQAEDAKALAIGVDIDGCGSLNWELRGKPVFRKGIKDLKELVDATEKPVIFKGNHGGRVLDSGIGVAEVLPEIVKACKGKITIMADGAVRTGFDVLKLLAIGADVVLLGRPLARMALAGGEEAIKLYLDYIRNDLRRGMIMTGCDTIDDISQKIISKSNLPL